MKWYHVVAVLMISLLFVGCKQKVGGEKDEYGCMGATDYSWNDDLGACVKEWELDSDDREAISTVVSQVGRGDGTTIISVSEGDCDYCFIVVVEKNGVRSEVLVEGEEIITGPPREDMGEEAELTENNDMTKNELEDEIAMQEEDVDEEPQDTDYNQGGGSGSSQQQETPKETTFVRIVGAINSDECVADGGRVALPGQCSSSEVKVADVEGLETAHICCYAGDIRNYDDCVEAGFDYSGVYTRLCNAFGVDYETECIERCGDGACTTSFCNTIDCVCAETKESCPEDCI